MGLSVAPSRDTATAVPRAGAGRRLRGHAVNVLLAAAVVLGAVVAIGAGLGYRGAVVLTGSMRPAIAPGDVVVADRVHPAQLHAGDIVMFADPHDAAITLTH